MNVVFLPQNTILASEIGFACCFQHETVPSSEPRSTEWGGGGQRDGHICIWGQEFRMT